MPETTQEPVKSESRAEKVIRMPGRDKMIEKLKEEKLYGLTPQSDRVYERYVSMLADQEKVAAGLVMAWELTLYDELKGYPPQVVAAISLYFDQTVDAIVPDPEIATQAKDYRRKVLEEAKQTQT